MVKEESKSRCHFEAALVWSRYLCWS